MTWKPCRIYKTFWSIQTKLMCCINLGTSRSSLEIERLYFVKEINPCRPTHFSDGSRASFACFSTLSRIMENSFLEGEPDTNLSSTERFIVLRLYGFPSTDVSGFYAKTFQHGRQSWRLHIFKCKTRIFLFFFHAKVRLERLVCFIVSNHSAFILYFVKWVGLNLRRT